VAVYDLGRTTSMTSSAFKAIVFVGFDGTFDPDAVIRQFRAQNLRSSRAVAAGPHGGKMACGYNASQSAPASECVWATKTTLGVVQFVSGQDVVKYPGASKVTLQVRQAVEVPAR
jgi:hypothetical protein